MGGLTRRQVTRCHVAQVSPTAVYDVIPQDNTEVILQESLVRYRSPSSSWLEAESPHERGTAAEGPILARQSFPLTTCEAFSLDHADSPLSSPRGSEEGDTSLHYLSVPGAVAETCVVHNMETPRDPVLAENKTLNGCGQRHRPLEERAEDKRGIRWLGHLELGLALLVSETFAYEIELHGHGLINVVCASR